MVDIIDLKNAADCLPMLARWHQKEWSYLNPGETIEQRKQRMQAYLNKNFIPSTYVARDKSLLGSAAIVENDMTNQTALSPWLASVFVAPEHRKKGIGTKLVRHIMAQAKQQGIKILYLYTPDQYLFYEKLGWQIHSTVQYHGHQVTIMQTFLNDE